MNRYGRIPMGRRADTKIAVTIRLPYDTYKEVVHRARKREWSMNHYVAHCIESELVGSRKPDRRRVPNIALEMIRDAHETGEDLDDAVG